MIVLLCPTRARPNQCKRMIESVVNTTDKSIRVDICLAFSEEESISYGIPLGPYNGSHVVISHYTMFDCPTAFKWNHMAEHQMTISKHKFFMLAADDMIFSTPYWDRKLREDYNGKPHVYAFRDSRDEDGTPHPIVTREYIEAMGYFLPPLFLHWYVDSWTVEIAKANDCFTHLKDYMLIHDKPYARGEPDDTHNSIRQSGWLNSDMWTNEHCQHFLALEKSRLKMRMV